MTTGLMPSAAAAAHRANQKRREEEYWLTGDELVALAIKAGRETAKAVARQEQTPIPYSVDDPR